MNHFVEIFNPYFFCLFIVWIKSKSISQCFESTKKQRCRWWIMISQMKQQFNSITLSKHSTETQPQTTLRSQQTPRSLHLEISLDRLRERNSTSMNRELDRCHLQRCRIKPGYQKLGREFCTELITERLFTESRTLRVLFHRAPLRLRQWSSLILNKEVSGAKASSTKGLQTGPSTRGTRTKWKVEFLSRVTTSTTV